MSDGFLGVPPQILAGVPVFQANTAYQAGQTVISPGGGGVTAKTPFTSTSIYDPANWNPTTQDVRIGAMEAKISQGDLVTNGSFRNGLTGWTNTGAWVVQTSTNNVTSWARTMSGGDGAFAQSITIPSWMAGKALRLKALAMTTSAGTLLTRITTIAGATSLNHVLTTSYVEYALDVTIPAGQGATPITLDIGRFSGTVYMTAIRLEAL